MHNSYQQQPYTATATDGAYGELLESIRELEEEEREVYRPANAQRQQSAERQRPTSAHAALGSRSQDVAVPQGRVFSARPQSASTSRGTTRPQGHRPGGMAPYLQSLEPDIPVRRPRSAGVRASSPSRMTRQRPASATARPESVEVVYGLEPSTTVRRRRRAAKRQPEWDSSTVVFTNTAPARSHDTYRSMDFPRKPGAAGRKAESMPVGRDPRSWSPPKHIPPPAPSGPSPYTAVPVPMHARPSSAPRARPLPLQPPPAWVWATA